MTQDLAGKFNNNAQGNILLNADLKAAYGPVIDAVASDLKGYSAVIALSEKEVLKIQEISNNRELSQEQKFDAMMKVMDESFPGHNLRHTVKSPFERSEFVIALEEACSDQKKGAIEAAAYSLITGNPAQPTKIGFMVLPDNPDRPPAYLMSNIPEDKHATAPASEQAKQNHNNGMMTVLHEIGHLVQAVKENKFHAYGAGFPKQDSMDATNVSERFSMEIFAERYAISKAQQMVNAGIISDMAIVQQRTDARTVFAFHAMIAHAFPIGDLKGTGIGSHSFGLGLDLPGDGKSVHDKLVSDLSSLRDFRNAEIKKSYDSVVNGQGTPEAQKVMAQILKELADPNSNASSDMKYFREKGATEEQVKMYLFGIAMANDPKFVHEMAQKMKDSPDVSSEAKKIVNQYLEAANRITTFAGPQNSQQVELQVQSRLAMVETPPPLGPIASAVQEAFPRSSNTGPATYAVSVDVLDRFKFDFMNEGALVGQFAPHVKPRDFTLVDPFVDLGASTPAPVREAKNDAVFALKA